VEEYGLFVQGLTLPAEGLIRVAGLDDDYYHYDDQMHALIGRRKGRHFRLGDKVKVEVARVDVDRRELDFNMIGPLESPEAGDSSARRSDSKKTGQGRGHSSGPGKDRKGTKARRRGSSRRRR
jgi:ribonuclease R